MLGYWGKPDQTALALRGGRLHTGDIGLLDVDGFLHLKDRKSDMILRGGANVYPAEVERVLAEDPRVSACAVIGIADERLGQRVVGAVQLAPGATVTEAELQERCAAQLARYKVPSQILLVEELPRSAMGKVQRRQIRSLFGNEP
jgi:acyl-CoA synthetase (AMP-forming)/AMP-acid ligase II